MVTGEKVDGPLTLTIYPGADGTGFLYEDDGETFDFRNGHCMRLEMQWNDTRQQLKLQLAHGSKLMRPGKMELAVRVAGTDITKQISFDGHPLSVVLS